MNSLDLAAFHSRVRRAIGYPPPQSVFRVMVDNLNLAHPDDLSRWVAAQSLGRMREHFLNALAHQVADREAGWHVVSRKAKRCHASVAWA